MNDHPATADIVQALLQVHGRTFSEEVDIALDHYDGDVLRLRDEADGDSGRLSRALQEFKGAGGGIALLTAALVHAGIEDDTERVLAVARGGAQSRDEETREDS